MSGRRFIQLLTVVLALGLVSSAGATPPGTNGRIVYSSDRSGNAELYSAGADGSTERRLTWSTDSEQEPSWSPDATKIAYSRAASGGRWRIWVMNADGSNQHQLTQTPGFDSSDEIQPQWSPDGTQVAFASTRIETYNVWVIDANGSALRRVTNFLSNDPAWSPDGTQLAYVGLNAIGVVNVDGTNAHPITGPGGWAGSPSWSPDGSRIAFNRNNDSGYPGELYLVNTDGANETQLTSGGFSNGHPSWSPDGTEIVFQRSGHLWRIGADGSNAQQITTTPDNGPDWGTSQVVPEPSPPEAPAIEIYSPVDGGQYFPGTNDTAFYRCFSFSSYIVSCDGDIPFGKPADFSWGTHTFTVRAVDGQGRTATKTITYQVFDIAAPKIDVRAPIDGATYDWGADVRVDYSCSDPGGSGIAECSSRSLPNGALLTNSPGEYILTVVALDNAGHLAAMTIRYTVVDPRPPSIYIVSPNDGGFYTLGSVNSAGYYCGTPTGARMISCSGSVPNGSLFDTSTVGLHSFLVSASDEKGRTATTTYTYTVVYDFKGFESPVDASDTVNGVRAGEGIALKFSLNGDQGLNVVAKTTWQEASCSDWTPTSGATAADAKLSYSTSTDRYKDIVTTSSTWRGTCRALRLELTDGTNHDVHVSFK